MDKIRYRISIDVGEDLYFRVINKIPDGERNALFRSVIAQVMEAIDVGGDYAVFMIKSRRLPLFMRSIDELREVKNTGSN